MSILSEEERYSVSNCLVVSDAVFRDTPTDLPLLDLERNQKEDVFFMSSSDVLRQIRVRVLSQRLC